MIGLIRAEWQKTMKNFKLTAFLLWVAPIGVVIFLSVFIATAMVSKEDGLVMATTSAGQWTLDMFGPWYFITVFPGNIFSRLLLIGFMVMSFAGEYQWVTWKNIIPRNRRWKLLLSKMIVLIISILISYTLTSFIVLIGQSIGRQMLDLPYGPTLTGEVFWQFVLDYGTFMLIAILNLIVLTGIAAVSAILTRNVLSSLLLGFGLSIVDSISLSLLSILNFFFDNFDLRILYKWMPAFHIENAVSWWATDGALSLPHLGFENNFSFWESIFALIIWSVLLFIGNSVIFGRQDIT